MQSGKDVFEPLKNGKSKLLDIDFIRFSIVGVVGFIVTALILGLLKGALKINIALATLVASEVGLISNFIFHQNWTYKYHSHKSIKKKLLHFHMSSWSGVAIITIIETISVKVFKIEYIVALAIAAIITMFWNFFWTKYFIFNRRVPKVLLDPEDIVPLKN
jgi:putative flippase GtrA